MIYPEQFEQFWKLYPGRTNKLGRIRKQDKLGAFGEWRRMTGEERNLAMSNHPIQGEFTPDARKWLKWKRWEDEDLGQAVSQSKTKLYPLKGKTCGKRQCRMPAVYHDTSGDYDSYACGPHMPEEVKKLYIW